MRRLGLYLGRSLTQMLLWRARTVTIVVGMRRSGNHALIHWIAGARTGCPVQFGRHSDFHAFETDPETPSVVLLNNLNSIRPLRYYTMLVRCRRRVRGTHVILSFEDTHLSYALTSFHTPLRCTERIVVRRGTLNVVASRLAGLLRAAREGHARQGFSLQRAFVAHLVSHVQADPSVWRVWSFEDWLQDAGYRRQFLEQIGLDFDHDPVVSQKGVGPHSMCSPTPLSSRPVGSTPTSRRGSLGRCSTQTTASS